MRTRVDTVQWPYWASAKAEFMKHFDLIGFLPRWGICISSTACTGPPGTLLITEATLIPHQAGGYAHVPGIWSDEKIARWKEITDAVHANESFISGPSDELLFQDRFQKAPSFGER
ncbi:hypothetical protein D9757_004232 [Collybiopsis confluens]|uniref:NADH:flavin oxidoreductase/NADH oxidase N-terminal domain-containing protein n=1 Tax=Collybiopsis confluens TaxID=2823264 RepID=A0A8H5HUB9_9AGAR|nr:hypothetical protein D9757_004232 [Collybiopsis confluens]